MGCLARGRTTQPFLYTSCPKDKSLRGIAFAHDVATEVRWTKRIS